MEREGVRRKRYVLDYGPILSPQRIRLTCRTAKRNTSTNSDMTAIAKHGGQVHLAGRSCERKSMVGSYKLCAAMCTVGY